MEEKTGKENREIIKQRDRGDKFKKGKRHGEIKCLER